jgi:DNA-binding transcriptional ArsR family regulator
MLNRLADVNRSDGGAPRTKRPATPDETRAMSHPLRLRIIRLLYDGPMSNRELATRLEQQPATVLHHVRTLLRTDFIVPAGERPGARGTTEKLYATTGKSWHLSVEDGPSDLELGHAMLDAFMAELAEVGFEADSSRLALVITPERRLEMQLRIAEVLQDYALLDDADGERWAVFVAFHRRP